MLVNLIVINILQCMCIKCVQCITLYTLKLSILMYQLYLRKVGEHNVILISPTLLLWTECLSPPNLYVDILTQCGPIKSF